MSACLGAADLGGSCVLHEVVEGHAAEAAQPGLQVLHAHHAVVAQARLRTRAPGDRQQVAAAHADITARFADLEGSQTHRAKSGKVPDEDIDRERCLTRTDALLGRGECPGRKCWRI